MTDSDDLPAETAEAYIDDVPAIVMFGDVRHRSAARRLGPHFNPGIEICLCRAGVYRWDVEGRAVEIRPGELSITRPWQEHSGRDNVLGPGRLSWIILEAAGEPGALRAPRLTELLGTDGEPVLKEISESSGAYLGHISGAVASFDRIREELRSREIGRGPAIRAEVSRLLVASARTLAGKAERSREDRMPSGVLSVLGDVATRPEREWTSAEMAEAAGLGLTAFTEWCRRATGRSPRWYVLEQRLLRARKLLRTSEKSVTDVGLETGFSSSQHFSTAFRRLYGISPSEFRAEHRR